MSEASRRWEKKNPEIVRAYRERYRAEHADELKKGRKRWEAANRDKVLAQRKRYRQRHPVRVWAQDLKKSGFTVELFELTLHEQQGKCAICNRQLVRGRTSDSMAADHDHATGKPRGILCRRCNSVIGFVDDNPALLIEAIRYLAFYRNERSEN